MTKIFTDEEGNKYELMETEIVTDVLRIKPLKPARWRANGKEREYWYLDTTLNVYPAHDAKDDFDNKNHNLGNYFKTKVQAELAAECIRYVFELMHSDKKQEDSLEVAAKMGVWKKVEAVRKALKGDILRGFVPLCSYCGRKTAKVVGQTVKGKYAQDNNHLPRNWGYYCQRCYDIGSELEREAMYG